MRFIIGYLFFMLFMNLAFLVIILIGIIPDFHEQFTVILVCAFTGGIGGITYCLRSVYLNYCVKERWNERWHIWYYLRPFASIICGAVSYIFLGAGLLVLEASQQADSSKFGFIALAFISGYNVDKFISKVEDVSEATWGIEKSRIGKGETKEE